MEERIIKGIRVLNGGVHDMIFVVGQKSDGEKITNIIKEDDNVFSVWLENGDSVTVISNNVMVYWTNK
jgi:hypothetical protein